MEINFKNVSYVIDNELILNNINMSLKKNKINGIIGNNGSGKTTLVKLICFILKPTIGTVKVGDYTNSKRSKVKRDKEISFNIAYISEDNVSINNCIKDEFKDILKEYNYKYELVNKRSSDTLELVGLDKSYLNRNYDSLSSTEKYFVNIAYTLILNPQVIIFDSPDMYIDEYFRQKLYKLINLLKIKYKKTVIITSSNVDFIHSICDYVVVIDNKKVIKSKDKYELFTDKVINQKIGVPKTIMFSNIVRNTKGVHLEYRDKVNDLIKDIYRHVK